MGEGNGRLLTQEILRRLGEISTKVGDVRVEMGRLGQRLDDHTLQDERNFRLLRESGGRLGDDIQDIRLKLTEIDVARKYAEDAGCEAGHAAGKTTARRHAVTISIGGLGLIEIARLLFSAAGGS